MNASPVWAFFLALIVVLVALTVGGVVLLLAWANRSRPRPVRAKVEAEVASRMEVLAARPRPVVARPVGSSRWMNSLPELLGLLGLILFALVAAAVMAYLGVGLSGAELTMLGLPALLYLVGFVWLLRLLLGRQTKPVRAAAQPLPPRPARRPRTTSEAVLFLGLGFALFVGLMPVATVFEAGSPARLLVALLLFPVAAACVFGMWRYLPLQTSSWSAALTAALTALGAGPLGLEGLSPAKKRFVAWLVPAAIFLLGAGTMLVYGFRNYTRSGWWEWEAVMGFTAFVVLAWTVRVQLRLWADPRFRSAEKAVPVPAVAIPAAAPAAPPRTCPKCHAPIAAGAPEGLCPRCLIGDLLPDDPRHSPTTAYGPFVPPEVEEVAAFFPQLEIVRLVGQGGMGAVYLARQKQLDRLVALKLINVREDDPTFAERFAREAKAMGKLSHPNIVTIHDHGTADGLPYLVMEYVDGVTLRDAMRAKALTPAEVLKVIPQVCDALEYAHAQGVVHRDVKPENILLDKSGKVKIADFGLAKLMDPDGMSLTHTRQAMGTPHYMAPEQWERPTEVDHRADIYALGVLLYELLTGELPLGRFDPPSVKSRMDARIDELVLRALAKEPDRRYQHASDVKLALERLGTPGGWSCTGTFREYKSKTTFLGWPLVHVTAGIDPRTGKPAVAKGWLAVGDSGAIGAVAVAGGWAVGGLALAGGGAVGVIGLAGGAAAGAFVALAGGSAFAGGMAVAGGAAFAKFIAIAGGFAWGKHSLSGSRQDADFAQRFREFWDGVWTDYLWPF